MKKSHMKTLLSKLMRWYPKGFPVGMSEMEFSARCDDYLEVLGDFDFDDVNEAINALVKTQTFLPSAAEILEAVKTVRASKVQTEAPSDFWDEDGYHYRRIDGRMVCVERPHNAYVPKDEELRRFLDEKRRMYAEVGAPYSYTMRQVQEMAKKQGLELEVQQDMTMLSRLTGGER